MNYPSALKGILAHEQCLNYFLFHEKYLLRQWTASISGNDWSFENGSKRGDIFKPDFVIKMQREGKEMRREETLNLLFCIFLCKSDSGICYVVKKSANLVVLPTKNADARPCVLNLDLSN